MADTVSEHNPRSRQRAAEALRRLPWLTEAQAALGWGIILILIALLGAIYLNQVSRIAITGRTVQRLQNELDILKRENAGLEKDIAAGQALEQLEARAVQFGFVRAQSENTEYLVIPGYPEETSVSTPAPPAVTEASVPAPQSLREAIWLLIQQRLGNLERGESIEQ